MRAAKCLAAAVFRRTLASAAVVRGLAGSSLPVASRLRVKPSGALLLTFPAGLSLDVLRALDAR